MAGHILVCGFGHVGYRVTLLLLRLGEQVTVIAQEAREEWMEEVTAAGATLFRGDARSERLLKEAGIETAAALIAATDRDLVNVEIALDAHHLRPDLPMVVRLFDQTLAQQLEGMFQIRRALGMSALAAPTFVGAAMGEQIIGSFRHEDTLLLIGQLHIDERSPLCGRTVQDVALHENLAILMVAQVDRSPVAPLPGTLLTTGDRIIALAEQHEWHRLASVLTPPDDARSAGWRVIKRVPRSMLISLQNTAAAVRRTPYGLRAIFAALSILSFSSTLLFHYALHISPVDALYFVTATVTTVGYGDITVREAPAAVKLYTCLLMLMGSAALASLYGIITDMIVTARFQQLLGRRVVRMSNHFIVVGLGTVGFRIVDKLRRARAPFLVIDRDPDGEFFKTVQTLAPVLTGDARLPETLERAGVARARAVIAVTGDDAVNLAVGIAARKMNPKARTVIRIFDPEFARKLKTTLNLDAALGAFSIAAPAFAAAALYADVRTGFVLERRLYAILERLAGEEWHHRRPSLLQQEQGIRIVMRRHTGETHFRIADSDEPLDRNEFIIAVVYRDLIH